MDLEGRISGALGSATQQAQIRQKALDMQE